MRADIIYGEHYCYLTERSDYWWEVYIDKLEHPSFWSEKEAWDYCISCGVNSCDINVYD